MKLLAAIRTGPALLLLGALGAPNLTYAIPTTWNYSGLCIEGDCDVVPSIVGTLSGDPSSLPPSDELSDFLFFGELTSYSFTLGTYSFSGSSAFGSYQLDATGNIIGGSMIFGNLLALEFLGVGSAAWEIIDLSCIFCKSYTNASGTGGYTTTTTAVPEPGPLSLIGAGLIAIGFARRFRRA